MHLVSLPTVDVDENAAIVNALQRHATVIVQKSLHEGFGLTVTEAMWKTRPVVASAVGGIQRSDRRRRAGPAACATRPTSTRSPAPSRACSPIAIAGREHGPPRRTRACSSATSGIDSLLRYGALIESLASRRLAAGQAANPG